MSAPPCICGHSKGQHSPNSENYDAPLECEDPDCWCVHYDPGEDELSEEEETPDE